MLLAYFFTVKLLLFHHKVQFFYCVIQKVFLHHVCGNGNDFLMPHTLGNLHSLITAAHTHEFPCYHAGICQRSAHTHFQPALAEFYKSSAHSTSQYQPQDGPWNYRWQERSDAPSGNQENFSLDCFHTLSLSHSLSLSLALHCFPLSPGFQ